MPHRGFVQGKFSKMATHSPATSSPDWITLAEAADRLSVSIKTCRRMIARGDLPAKRIGSRLIRVPVAALEAVGRDLAVSYKA
jgi:excisionase family DNA binding protein